jgi:hypothetical protein
MYNYCTLFDSNYLTRGLAMYQSLKQHSDNFHLYIFAFDSRSYELLKKLNLTSVTIISLNEFEDKELKEAKKDRTPEEYCWTCTPSVIKYSIEKFNLSSCTYLDADIYFFSNPDVLIKEMGSKSILITEHRYSHQYKSSIINGIYNVQFLTFKNDKNGMKALQWWRESCIDWCYRRYEDGKMGDQKYLDDWTSRFKGVHVLQHLGGGVAPWNVQQYKLERKDFKLIFYHFHGFKILPNNKVDLSIFRLRKDDIRILYKPYLLHLEKIKQNILVTNDNYDYHGVFHSKKFSCKNLIHILRRLLNRTYNIYTKNYILEL